MKNGEECVKMKFLDISQKINRNDLFGSMDSNLSIMERKLGVKIIQRDNQLIVKGSRADDGVEILHEMIEMLERGENLDQQKVNYIIDLKLEGATLGRQEFLSDIICFTHESRPLVPKTLGQKNYVDAIRKKDVVFGIGPAGTGKTYIAVAMAVNAYKSKKVQKIILTRPAVEAGERLGFLPGDLQEKVDPYLRPLYDALYEMLGRENAGKLREKDVIEIVPLAYMRGRTMDNAFIILDEAQNTTPEQMKMFLTRMGFGSKVVVTGDITQIDLPRGRRSGLLEAARVLKNVNGIDFCWLRDVDVVRHELVKAIIKAYDEYHRDHPLEDE